LASASDALKAEDLHTALKNALPEVGETIMPTLAEKWIEEGEAALLIRQMEHKFGQLTPAHRARIDAADAETLLIWGERVLTAQTVEEVFAG
jgi:hypothetical protein